MQSIAVIIILAVAVSLAGWHVYKTLRRSSDPCEGCSGCDLKEQICSKKQEKAYCCHKN